jgi:pimeloyl-ACP methyl ester carboxylesterase
MRRAAVAGHLSISSLTERLTHVTALAVTREMPACDGVTCHDALPGREQGAFERGSPTIGKVEIVSKVSTPAERLVTGRSSRRRFLAGVAAAGLTPVAVAAEATLGIGTKDYGGTIMAQHTEAAVTTDYLTVPGARLYYEVSGSGPVLLFIPGGTADAAGFAPLARFLEDSYTVVRYDPRGISHSRLEGPGEDVPVEVHADDVQQLLEAMSAKPAFVLGHSGGAVIGLALVERHPELVQTYVAHEPPLIELLPEGDERRNDGQKLYDTYRKEGAAAAMEQFMSTSGMDEAPPVEMSPEAQEFLAQQMASMEQNFDFFFAHYLLPITSYSPDYAALQGASTRVLVGVGEDSVGQETYDTAVALAERLGSEPVVFPGDHIGMATLPEEFAEKLHDVFQEG